ncbi:circularly permuted type 2 ATP-grasp protein [Lolliginicoccus levis]|uniref:circularly permuted type 2 ATP-grasp protein n=1 Tax=Lolliginicoccus levis TaxID=2919542 RepID=UPI00241FE8F2|nr:circularly permuted type 2 ATP-grasp protein [Lolliginicoccus levis]
MGDTSNEAVSMTASESSTGRGTAAAGEASDAEAVLSIGAEHLRRLRGRVRRLVAHEGITFTPEETQWNLDPVPLIIPDSRWSVLESAMLQRSRLLAALLTDLYGEQRTISEGLIPPELVYGHRGFLRSAHGTHAGDHPPLFLHAMDVADTVADGHVVLEDRAQAPLGIGYALADRKVITHAVPGLHQQVLPRTLTSFIQVMRIALESASAGHEDDPVIVILSPGPDATASFDHAFLASMLGYPLVESTDLTVSDGRLWMRALGKRMPIDVVVRFIDSAATDPLDQRSPSRTGVAGLTEMVRRGAVRVVNPLGCGVVENPALGHYLPRVSQALLDEDLQLPSVDSWWAGDSAGRSHVRERIADLVCENIRTGESVIGADLTRAQRAELCQRIDAETWQWSARLVPEQPMQPVITAAGGVADAPITLRMFSVAQRAGYTVMPGGFAHTPIGHRAESSSPGVKLAKDVWVRSAERTAEGGAVTVTPTEPPEPVAAPRAGRHGLSAEGVSSPRVLNDFFWLGRYAERAEDTARLLIAVRDRHQDYRARPWLTGSSSLAVLVTALGTVAGSRERGDADGSTADRALRELRSLTGQADRTGSLAYCVRKLESAARGVRDQLSLDTWMVLSGVNDALDEFADDTSADPVVMASVHSAVLGGMLALSGLGSESLVRDPAWHVMDLGRRIERASQLAALIGATLSGSHPESTESALMESVLLACESSVMYRRRQHGVLRVAPLAEFLFFDASNPRALVYQLERIRENFASLPEQAVPARALRLAEEILTKVRRADPQELEAVDEDGERSVLSALTRGVREDLRELSDIVENSLLAPPVDMQPIWVTVGGVRSSAAGITEPADEVLG